MKHTSLTIALLILCSQFSASFAQTQHAGLVGGIESKAKQILALEKEIASSKEQIADLEQDRRSDIANARARLDAALNHIKTDPSWINRKRTAEEGWREHSPGTCSAGGPPPICPANHWHRANIADSIKEFEDRKEAYLKPYKDAVDQAGKGQLSLIDNLYDRIKKMEGDIERLKAELIALTKRYQDAVEQEAKAKSIALARDLISVVADVHQTEDSIAECEERIRENEQEEARQKREAVAKVEAQLSKLKTKLERDIDQIEERHASETQQLQLAIEQCRSRIERNNREIESYNARISSYEGSEQGKALLEERKNSLEAANYREQDQIKEYNNSIRSLEDKKRSAVWAIRDQLFKLNADEGGMLREAKALVQEAFEARRSVLLASRQAKVDRVAHLRTFISERTNQLNAVFNKWVSAVDQERIRVMQACASVSTSCYGTYVVNEANVIWSKERDCIGQLLRMRSPTGVVYGCEASTAYYNAIYRGPRGSTADSKTADTKRKRIEGRLGSLLHTH